MREFGNVGLASGVTSAGHRSMMATIEELLILLHWAPVLHRTSISLASLLFRLRLHRHHVGVGEKVIGIRVSSSWLKLPLGHVNFSSSTWSRHERPCWSISHLKISAISHLLPGLFISHNKWGIYWSRFITHRVNIFQIFHLLILSLHYTRWRPRRNGDSIAGSHKRMKPAVLKFSLFDSTCWPNLHFSRQIDNASGSMCRAS